jgi:hypothetical protein
MAGGPDFASIPTLKGAPSKLRLGGVFDFFHHKPSVSRITDIQPAMRDNEDLIGQRRSVSVSRDGPRRRPKAISSAL